MKYLWISVLCAFLISCQGNTQNKAQLKTSRDSVSYSIGMNIGQNLKAQMVEVDPVIVGLGIKDILDSAKTVITEDQAKDVMTTFQKTMMAKQEAKMKADGEKQKVAGAAFLEENKKKEGVVTLPDGLQYKVITMGTGKRPDSSATVVVNYVGKLIDGTEFDSSVKRGQPAEFALRSVVRGWTEALQLMPVGSKWTIYIPAELAWGERGAGNAIPPNAAVIFDVELLSIK
jgi:FKBP-type peptidyl-prolyl cis-trans isomerase FklB